MSVVVAGALLVLAATAAAVLSSSSSAAGDDVFGAQSTAGTGRGRPVVPAVYVFGDSLVDAGNNDFLPPPAPRALPPNGVDLPRTVRRRTGRFTNAYNLADIIGALPAPAAADLQCLLLPPPILSLLRVPALF
jgi:hypothetical protein